VRLRGPLVRGGLRSGKLLLGAAAEIVGLINPFHARGIEQDSVCNIKPC